MCSQGALSHCHCSGGLSFHLPLFSGCPSWMPSLLQNLDSCLRIQRAGEIAQWLKYIVFKREDPQNSCKHRTRANVLWEACNCNFRRQRGIPGASLLARLYGNSGFD